MKFRNPKYNALGSIDVEIEHPMLGWIPFTASATDPELHGQELFAEVAKGPVNPYTAPPPPPPRELTELEKLRAEFEEFKLKVVLKEPK